MWIIIFIFVLREKGEARRGRIGIFVGGCWRLRYLCVDKKVEPVNRDT